MPGPFATVVAQMIRIANETTWIRGVGSLIAVKVGRLLLVIDEQAARCEVTPPRRAPQVLTLQQRRSQCSFELGSDQTSYDRSCVEFRRS